MQSSRSWWPKKPRVTGDDLVAFRIANRSEKRCSSRPIRIGSSPSLTQRFPAILVRLAAIDVDELEELISDAWRCQAPRALVKEFERLRGD